jgi:hypothetical protein
MRPVSEVFEPCDICRKNHSCLVYGHPKVKKMYFESKLYEDCPIYNAKPELNETLETQPETN